MIFIPFVSYIRTAVVWIVVKIFNIVAIKEKKYSKRCWNSILTKHLEFAWRGDVLFEFFILLLQVFCTFWVFILFLNVFLVFWLTVPKAIYNTLCNACLDNFESTKRCHYFESNKIKYLSWKSLFLWVGGMIVLFVISVIKETETFLSLFECIKWW